MSTTAYTAVKIQEAAWRSQCSCRQCCCCCTVGSGVAPPRSALARHALYVGRPRQVYMPEVRCSYMQPGLCAPAQTKHWLQRRDKTAFVPIKQFNTVRLVSDLHFLEEVEHNAERARTHLNNVVGSHSHHVKTPGGKRKAEFLSRRPKGVTKLNKEVDGDKLLHQNESSDTGGVPGSPQSFCRSEPGAKTLDAASSRGLSLCSYLQECNAAREHFVLEQKGRCCVLATGWQRSGGVCTQWMVQMIGKRWLPR